MRIFTESVRKFESVSQRSGFERAAAERVSRVSPWVSELRLYCRGVGERTHSEYNVLYYCKIV